MNCLNDCDSCSSSIKCDTCKNEFNQKYLLECDTCDCTAEYIIIEAKKLLNGAEDDLIKGYYKFNLLFKTENGL